MSPLRILLLVVPAVSVLGCANAIVVRPEGACVDDDECRSAERCVDGGCERRFPEPSADGTVDGGPRGPVGALPTDCSSFTFGASSYVLCSAPRTFGAAIDACGGLEGDLLQLNDNGDDAANRSERRALDAFATGRGIEAYWIGLTDIEREGSFIWSDGRTVSLASPSENGFALGEPNDAFGEDCVAVREDGLWNDVDCGATAQVVCETLVVASAPPGDCALRTLEGRQLVSCTTARTATEAATLCDNVGGVVVHFGDAASSQSAEAEQVAVHDVARAAGVTRYWLGLSDGAREGTFLWSNATRLLAAQSHFAPGEPNAAGGEDCVVAVANQGWVDLTCTRTRATMCEFR